MHQHGEGRGGNQIISAYAVHNILLAEHPEELRTLYQPFHIDRRGGVREGESPTIQLPVFEWDGSELLLRYLRYWIEVGHQKVGVPLSAAQTHALDTLDRVLARRDLAAEFALKRGQVLLVNNRWIFHNRTAFEDFPEPERRRHLVRLWLQAPQSARRRLAAAS